MSEHPELTNVFKSLAADHAAQIQAARNAVQNIGHIDQRIETFIDGLPNGKFRPEWVADQIDVTLTDVLRVLSDDRYIDLGEGFYIVAVTDWPAMTDQARLAAVESARLAAVQIDDSEARIKAFMRGLPAGDYSAQFVADQIDVTLTDVMCFLDDIDDAPDFGDEFHVHRSGDVSRYWDNLADDDDDLADDSDYWDKERCVQCQEVIHGQNFDGLCEACYEYYTRRDDDLADDTGHDEAGPGLWPRYRDLLADLDASDTTERLEIAYRLDGLIDEAKEVIAYRADLFTITARPASAHYAIIINPKKSAEPVTLTGMSLNDLLVKAADHLLTLDRPDQP